ncbi:acetyl-CoA acetyltransferase [Erythrobacter sp. W53]|uniref:acetyl-CoA acetyltransferase n=1 Tax=Erythrobacter sp. W53 TaxID=3425947 RepID=UPI003D769A19
MSNSEERIPVIVGVGQINDRPDDPANGLDPTALMAAALHRADEDAGGGWLEACDSLAVVSQLAWPHLNPVDGKLAETLGIAPAHREQTAMPNGDSPIRLLNEAANRIGAGEAKLCAVVGAEALRTAAKLAAARQAANKEQGGGQQKKPNALRDASHRVRKGYVQSHGLTVPVDVYPLYENALRHKYGQTLAEAQAESGAIWSGFSQTAAANENAWMREAVSPVDVVTTSGQNRPIAFPYTKLQVANSSVNQGAGFLVTSLAEARRRGVPEGKLIYVGYGAAAHEDNNFMTRARFDGSASLETSISKAMELNTVTTTDLAHVELYSCFPCVPKMARRVLDWPLDRPMSVFGGLTFGGGPIGNYMSHAVASMVDALRESGGKGLLFANGGYATHNHTILISAEPLDAQFPQDFDYQAEADAKRGAVPEMDRDYTGPATLETYTVHYKRDSSVKLGTIVAATPNGDRTLAIVRPDDEQTLAFLTGGTADPIGASGTITRDEDGVGFWSGV